MPEADPGLCTFGPMPDATPNERGVPLFLQMNGLYQAGTKYPTHIAREIALDEAREAVIAAARKYATEGSRFGYLVERTLFALDAAEGER